MLTALGPEHARLFVLRRDGEPHCWDLVTVSGKRAVAYYGASSSASRGFRGAEALDWFVPTARPSREGEGLAVWESPCHPAPVSSTSWLLSF